MSATKYLSRGQAAKIIGVSMTTLIDWQEAGTFLPAIVAENGFRFYDRAEVERKAAERAEKKGATNATPNR